ncbi:GRB10-interacting GYF protein 1 isoform X1 [Silurus meridionalis]|uniref:GYF domain-containing protein n=1 Tax=Silurus meridionalis TaxID=175797 RepID=A0A8T0B511_SILME|nr:GRB10-interacting GYF protein 1 isoform X1 [Silurus meridionalis]KAF7700899.1 hypothetical protein HF521_002064 [Silurus meridionalis]
MTAETLNFGPEWLRALSRGGSITSPPSSPAMPKSKLADYRYGREEMLALYIKDNKVPEDLQDKEFAAILQNEPQQPLALVSLTEEEQRNFSMSVNSVAVLRLMSKGVGAATVGVSRSRGNGRGGRGRGRGEGGFYQRGVDEDVGFGRSRELHHSQSWDDRGDRRFEKPLRREGGRGGFEDGGTGKKDYNRSDSDNWRTLREELDEEDGGEDPGVRWRMAVTRRDDGGQRSAGWREHANGDGRRRKFDFDFRDGDGVRRRAGSEGGEEDRDRLPEWCTDEDEGEMGMFDSSGAFMCIKKMSKDQEFEFEALEEEDEPKWEKNDSSFEKAEDTEGHSGALDGGEIKTTTTVTTTTTPPASVYVSALNLERETHQSSVAPPIKFSLQINEDTVPVGGNTQPPQSSPAGTSPLLLTSPPVSTTDILPPSGDTEEEDGMTHMQQEAEKMVASLQDTSLEEERFTQALQESHGAAVTHTHAHPIARAHSHPNTHTLPHSAGALPLTHESAMKWFYKDPQGEVQGPFSPVEMCEWFQAGYFTMTLLVKRGCDEGFQPLGEVIKMWGRVPFSPGPSPPPLLGNIDQEMLKKQYEQATNAALYQQLQMRFPHVNNRCGDAGMMTSMNRSVSESWDIHTSSSQTSGADVGLWDLTITNSPQGPTLEQLQKLQQERREAELRVKREDEERKRREEKRRQQEEQKRREEEELYRRKREQQCRQQELLMKLLQQSQQRDVQGGAGWSSVQAGTLSLGKSQGKNLGLLEQQQQRTQQRHSMGQWSDGSVGMWTGMEGKISSSSSSMGIWDEALKNQANHCNVGMKTSMSAPSFSSEQYMINRNRKRTEEEERLLKLLQGMKPQQDGFTTWCEQMLHALNTSTNNSSSSVDVATIVAYLKEVDSPYEVHDFIRSYLGDTVEAKEFAKQFLERRAKQKANQQRQQQQLCKEIAGLNMNFPLQSVFQTNHMSKSSSMYNSQGGKMKKPSTMLHSDPSVIGYSFLGSSDRMMLGEMEAVEDY